MQFLEIKITCPSEVFEMILAELVEAGYDSFAETDEGLDAYIDESLFEEPKLKEILGRYVTDNNMPYSFSKLENKNWNEEWEKNFQPVIIGDQCIIRASFHPNDKKYPFDIVINPKMSFGTGHHETTSMMVQYLLEIDQKGKIVMDAGSGTGILAIMSSKSGAKEIEAFDIEDWAFENLNENVNLNDCNNIKAYKGTIKEVPLKNEKYDVILANINKNVLLSEISTYSEKINIGGALLLSGFYTWDNEDILAECVKNNLLLKSSKEKNNWSSLLLEKQ